jgi:hypothetical protein
MTPTTTDTWNRVDVSSSAALARTKVSLLGVLDNRAIDAIDEAVELADANHHTLTFELGQMSSITPEALAALLSRSHPPYDGPLVFPSAANPAKTSPDASDPRPIR